MRPAWRFNWATLARTLGAFAIAPLIPGAAVFAYGLVNYEYLHNTEAAAWGLNFAAIISYIATVVLGLPMYLILRSLRQNRLPIYLIGGGFIGVMVHIIFMYNAIICEKGQLCVPKIIDGAHLLTMGLAIFFGLASSLVFWLIARPDRSSFISK